MRITFSFAFSSRFLKIQTSDFRKAAWQQDKGVVGVLYGFCCKFSSLSNGERILKLTKLC